MPRATIRLAALLLPASVLACTISAREPEGEQIWTTLDGTCEGSCATEGLYRDADSLEYRFVETPGANVIRLGTLTEQGLAEYEAASSGISPDQVFETCSEADGVDVRAVALAGDSTFEVEFCGSEELDPRIVRFNTFFSGLVEALRDCKSNAWVDAC